MSFYFLKDTHLSTKMSNIPSSIIEQTVKQKNATLACKPFEASNYNFKNKTQNLRL